jgi:hypothetical protein
MEGSKACVWIMGVGGWVLHGDISGKGPVVAEAKAGAGDWQWKLRCVFVAKPHISGLMKTVLSGAIDASDWCGWIVVCSASLW